MRRVTAWRILLAWHVSEVTLGLPEQVTAMTTVAAAQTELGPRLLCRKKLAAWLVGEVWSGTHSCSKRGRQWREQHLR